MTRDSEIARFVDGLNDLDKLARKQIHLKNELISVSLRSSNSPHRNALFSPNASPCKFGEYNRDQEMKDQVIEDLFEKKQCLQIQCEANTKIERPQKLLCSNQKLLDECAIASSNPLFEESLKHLKNKVSALKVEIDHHLNSRSRLRNLISETLPPLSIQRIGSFLMKYSPSETSEEKSVFSLFDNALSMSDFLLQASESILDDEENRLRQKSLSYIRGTVQKFLYGLQLVNFEENTLCRKIFDFFDLLTTLQEVESELCSLNQRLADLLEDSSSALSRIEKKVVTQPDQIEVDRKSRVERYSEEFGDKEELFNRLSLNNPTHQLANRSSSRFSAVSSALGLNLTTHAILGHRKSIDEDLEKKLSFRSSCSYFRLNNRSSIPRNFVRYGSSWLISDAGRKVDREDDKKSSSPSSVSSAVSFNQEKMTIAQILQQTRMQKAQNNVVVSAFLQSENKTSEKLDDFASTPSFLRSNSFSSSVPDSNLLYNEDFNVDLEGQKNKDIQIKIDQRKSQRLEDEVEMLTERLKNEKKRTQTAQLEADQEIARLNGIIKSLQEQLLEFQYISGSPRKKSVFLKEVIIEGEEEGSETLSNFQSMDSLPVRLQQSFLMAAKSHNGVSSRVRDASIDE
eukprot:GDKJ01063903.1.p1 GENE.GDKJ01063903.1~~GDKJ01063903.1.p1  ORF type:complete len:627 (+),score=154.53 GDKJ01063903.1:25-1905(+)